MTHFVFVVTRLWRYFSLYFLKPFDAVNDTLTASLVRRLDWHGRFVEIGSGDGVYSYIMHGGTFPLWFDRYLLTDLSRTDIYDTHRGAVVPRSQPIAWPTIAIAVDVKPSHVAKIQEIGFARNAVCAAYEALPIATGSIERVFFYTPHGLRDHQQAVREAHRILADGGRALVLLYDSVFRSAFLCYRLGQLLPGALGRYFSRLDNGRYDEITNLSRDLHSWPVFFASHGFTIRKFHSGLSTFAWAVYDVQTRPVLKLMIRSINTLPSPVRTVLKVVWMAAWFPILLLFYILFSNEFVRIDRKSCYLAYELEKVST